MWCISFAVLFTGLNQQRSHSCFLSLYVNRISSTYIVRLLHNIADVEVGYREIEIREQDRFLPVANIARIMKKILPPNAKIAKEAKESIQTCVSEFISFVTSEASGKLQISSNS